MKQLFTSFRPFLFTILLGSTITNIFAQTSATIEPRNYSQAKPFVIPSLANGSVYNLTIKTGKPVPTVIDLADINSMRHGTPDGRNLLDISSFIIDVPGTWGLTWYQNGNERSIACIVNYQADLQDQTIGSATYGDYPDFIWVAQGGSAAVSAGKYMAAYAWRYLDNTKYQFTGGAQYTDSLKTLGINTYFVVVVDANTNLTKDTISILEKPTFNNSAKTLNFPSTTAGITYKLLKVGSISGTDTTWTETQNFVGDGNAKDITFTDGKYKLTTTLGIHTAVYPYGYFVVGVTTAIDKTKEENIHYRLVDNNLQFDNEVNLEFYSLQGQLLQQEQGSSFKLCSQAGIFKATDKNGNVLTAKIILK